MPNIGYGSNKTTKHVCPNGFKVRFSEISFYGMIKLEDEIERTCDESQFGSENPFVLLITDIPRSSLPSLLLTPCRNSW